MSVASRLTDITQVLAYLGLRTYVRSGLAAWCFSALMNCIVGGGIKISFINSFFSEDFFPFRDIACWKQSNAFPESPQIASVEVGAVRSSRAKSSRSSPWPTSETSTVSARMALVLMDPPRIFLARVSLIRQEGTSDGLRVIARETPKSSRV